MRTPERREFFVQVAAIAATGGSLAAVGAGAASGATNVPNQAGAPSAPGGPGATVDAVTEATIAEAEKLAGIRFTASERTQLIRTIGEQQQMLAARMAAGPLSNDIAPAEVFRAELPGLPAKRVTTEGDPNELPVMKLAATPPADDELSYAGIPHLAALLRAQVVTSRTLTGLALARLERLNPTLLCAITVVREQALRQADALDAELRAGTVRGPLHGIPYAAKDLLDTKGIATTWGAEPFRSRVPDRNAWVVSALDRAGAVLVAKTAVGALAYGDIWFGGTCKNPWNTKQGSSGSSAGSASAVGAGIVPFAIGTETLGSIVSPSVRCGVSGLRPTFGRVPRTGCMALVWSMDKIGAIARSATDCGIVLNAMNASNIATAAGGGDPSGGDPSGGDPSCVAAPFTWSMQQSARGLRVGYAPEWFEGRDNSEGDDDAEGGRPSQRTSPRAALDALRDAGATLVELKPPTFDASALIIPLITEAAAAFEDLTRSGADDTLAWQADEAWPNSFRQAWFIPAVAAVQASRIRRQAMHAMHEFFNQADCVVCPPFAGQMLLLTNACGQPCVVARAGFAAPSQPRSVTLMGRLFDEGTPLRAAAAIEARLGAWDSRPSL